MCHQGHLPPLAGLAQYADELVDQGDNVLSGRSVIALLNALRTTVYAGTGQEVETWALAVTCYERIAQVVNATRPATDEQQLTQPRIVLDDLSMKSAA
ncbi:hypothetical protein [Streptomyces sp. H27-D2]|uniref:hypothetical protein n=1 Tax=Streptomyces sp. H27-D2 TaxID=3046304 RepID=UPI002DB6C7C6|nr:hypothetical protein [Streptomyces sp. H27-D2]MEC4014968.1 hypothetical protein [Streptomyces sp. H27-D2]